MRSATVLITGASSGIGEALAMKFAEDDYNLVLVARSQDKLQVLAKQLESKTAGQVLVEVVDLSQRESAKKLSATLGKQNIEVEVLVNCAGVLEHGRFVDLGVNSQQNMIDLNVSGLTSMLNYFLPPMVERGSGRVLNVASIAAFQPVPSLAAYAATKAYVLSLSESLVEELSGTGVSITALCPGVTATNMVANAKRKSEGLEIPGYIIGEVDEVASQGYQACLKGDAICVPGAINLAATLAGRATPRWMLRRISGLMGRYSLGRD
ncbi:MAG: SDR family NAD(P)-dependent oxidoreductase [Pseudomonadales bacterium]